MNLTLWERENWKMDDYWIVVFITLLAQVLIKGYYEFKDFLNGK